MGERKMKATLALPPGMSSTDREPIGLPPGVLALSTGPEGGEREIDPTAWRIIPTSHEDIGEGPFPTFGAAEAFRANELHPELANSAVIVGNRPGSYSIGVHRDLRRQIAQSDQQEVMNPTHAVHAPAEPDYHDPAYPKVISWHNDIAYTVPVHPQALSKEHMQALADFEVHRRQHERLEKQLHGERDENGDRPWVVSEEAERRLDKSQERLNRLEREEWKHRVVSSPMMPGYRFKLGTVYTVHDARTGRMKVNRAFASEGRAREEFPDDEIIKTPRVWMVLGPFGDVRGQGMNMQNIRAPKWSKLDTAARYTGAFAIPERPDMSKVPIVSWGKTRKKTGNWFSNLPPGMIAMSGRNKTAAKLASLLSRYEEGDEPMTVNDVVDEVESFADEHPRLQRAVDRYRREQEYDRSLAGRGDMDAAEERFLNTVRALARRDESKPPKDGDEPLELAGTDPVEQESWQVQNLQGTPYKVKDVPLGEGEDNVLHFQAAPQRSLIFTPETETIRRTNGLDLPHDLLITRGKTYSKDITGQGKSPQFLSHGHHAVRDFLQQYRPMALTFTAQEPSRQKAYYHVMRNLAKDPQASKEYRFFGKPGDYYFHAVHKSIAEIPFYAGMRKMEIGGAPKPSLSLPH